MSVFGDYSKYYNLLYADKDYRGEADYLHGLIQAAHPTAKKILDLGCGTGRHDELLVEKGYSVFGVDLSEQMIQVAQAIERKNLQFAQGDVRTIRLSQSFDAVVSLFHVMSYQISNSDIDALFQTAKAHLSAGGLFVFDCWYGPAVLHERPVLRVKRLESVELKVTRIAEPVMHPNLNVVEVNYELFLEEKLSGGLKRMREVHPMRYLFMPEIMLFAERHGFEILLSEAWISKEELGEKTWSACFVLRTK
jgi:SAM-dependent methyltransferase